MSVWHNCVIMRLDKIGINVDELKKNEEITGLKDLTENEMF